MDEGMVKRIIVKNEWRMRATTARTQSSEFVGLTTSQVKVKLRTTSPFWLMLAWGHDRLLPTLVVRLASRQVFRGFASMAYYKI
ncbi:hypothetical protein PI125_g4199 [Phytophthora idaei]|nr:hypothetical protein PI125_g4199 [Phytophthora idaei]